MSYITFTQEKGLLNDGVKIRARSASNNTYRRGFEIFVVCSLNHPLARAGVYMTPDLFALKQSWDSM